jgi:hypothetical protein
MKRKTVGWQNKGQIVGFLPAGSIKKTQVFQAVYQPELHIVPEMRAGVVRE